ncbi:MAG: hypothetical protein BroJett003_05800 [Planctomycetota bacterium]|nr:MAG: hypothetical protein BroJett003_05800 [Planctomycetota bacterium]
MAELQRHDDAGTEHESLEPAPSRSRLGSNHHDLELPGCTPEPLMAYLKALGILRLVAEQKDRAARGWWKNDVFWLRSPGLFSGAQNDKEKRDALVKFFLEEYKPTPLVAPWNAGSGFYLKWDEKKNAFKKRDATEAVSKIESSTSDRFQRYREQIQAIKEVLNRSAKPFDPAKEIKAVRERGQREHWSAKKTKDEIKKLLDSQMLFAGTNGETLAIGKADKDALVREARSALLHDLALQWIDTAFVIRTGRKKNRVEAPLLGSGGNIGNSDFSARFMQLLADCVPLASGEAPSHESARSLLNAILGGPTAGLASLAVDQFYPGRAGGANMFQGLEAKPRLNPWDYVLMLEGAVMLRGAANKRLGNTVSESGFPFAVESTPAGFDSAGPGATRGEQWLPLWDRACTAGEIATLLAEGRSDLGRRRARTGVEFARAAASLGVDRGIRQFVRVQYQARFGDNYLANSLGRVGVVARDSVDLLHQLDRWRWLDGFCRAAGDKNAPPRFASALRRIDSAIFDFCKYGGAAFFQRIVIALGAAERELANVERFREDKKLKPLAGLSAEWIGAADDGSREYSVALALAGVHHEPDGPAEQPKIGPLRTNLEPVDWQKRCRAWAEKERCVVWNAADLATNLANVLQRRMMDGERAGCQRLPLDSPFSVPLDVIAAFIAGELDDARIEELIWGLMLIDTPRGDLAPAGMNQSRDGQRADPNPLPREYALLKLLFLPRPLVAERSGDKVYCRLARNGESGIVIRPEPRILPLLRAGRIGEACRIAAQRLRVSGLPPMPGPLLTGVMRDGAWAERIIEPRRAQRLAAALLIPISSKSVNRFVHLVCRADESAAAEALAFSAEGESE